MSTYGHVIDELEDAPRIAAEEAITAARRGEDVRTEFRTRLRGLSCGQPRNHWFAAFLLTPPAGFEPAAIGLEGNPAAAASVRCR